MLAAEEAPARIAILTVTRDAEQDLDGYFAALEALEENESFSYQVVVVDSESTDGTLARLEAHRSRWPFEVVAEATNLGFAAGMNLALSRVSENCQLILSLNADARPRPGAVLAMAEACGQAWRRSGEPSAKISSPPRIGAVAGRLYRPPAGDEPRILDACGMRLSATWRHFDRGSGEVDRGQLSFRELVFGATGAGSLFSREALVDVAIDGCVFDPLFHSFREDAELCFRLQERGWSVLYEPRAEIEHRRFNLPERRGSMSPEVNFHALKNRYLLRIYHQTTGNFFSTLVPAGVRELGILLYLLLFERSSLAVYPWLWHHRQVLLERRRTIQRRRTATSRSVNRWFWQSAQPLARTPAPR